MVWRDGPAVLTPSVPTHGLQSHLLTGCSGSVCRAMETLYPLEGAERGSAVVLCAAALSPPCPPSPASPYPEEAPPTHHLLAPLPEYPPCRQYPFLPGQPSWDGYCEGPTLHSGLLILKVTKEDQSLQRGVGAPALRAHLDRPTPGPSTALWVGKNAFS